LKRIRAADAAQLMAVDGISQKDAELIVEFFAFDETGGSVQ